MIIFGGCDDKCQFNDLWIYDSETKMSRATPTKGKAPSPRAFHSAIARGSELIIFGGAYYNQGITGREKGIEKERAKEKRKRDSNLFIAAPWYFLNDIHVLDTLNMEWRALRTGGYFPKPCCQAAMTIIKYVFCFFFV